MYTVLRVTAEPENLDRILAIGVEMNAIRPGVYDGLRRAGDGFASSVSSSPAWSVHLREMSAFLDEFAAPLEKLAAAGAALTFDVAVDWDDREAGGPILVLRSAPSFLERLASRSVALEVSLYPTSTPDAEYAGHMSALIAAIEQRPRMYFESLRELEILLFGYQRAFVDLGLLSDEAREAIHQRFLTWLERRHAFGDELESGWASAFVRRAGGDEGAAAAEFFAAIRAFVADELG